MESACVPPWRARAASAIRPQDRPDGARVVRAGRTLLLLACLIGAAAPAARAQDRLSEIHREYEDLLAYLGVADRASPETVQRLAALDLAIWESSLPTEQRHDSVAEYVRVVWPLLELDRSYRMVRDVEAVATQVNGIVDAYGEASRPDLLQHRRLPAREAWQPHVVEEGTGDIPVLLIADIGVEAQELYGAFMQENRTRYRMFAVTFPGMGAAERQPFPARRDYAKRTWLSRFEAAIAAYLAERGLEDVVVVGTAAGGYVAARLALDHPERIRAAVLVGALLHTTARSPADPNLPLTPEERLEDANRMLPIQLSPLPRPPSDPEEVAAILRDPDRSHPGLFNLFLGAVLDVERTIAWSSRLASTYGGISTAYQYYYELYTTDLGEELGELTVPTLALVPGYAGTTPGARAMALSQWQEAALRYPDAPLQVAVFEDQPTYIATESPALFALALANFLAGRPVRGHSLPVPAVLPTPRASVTQSIDSLEVTIRYHRPSVGERNLWGESVPYGRIWNPGAAETTTIGFSREARVGGQPLAPGTYALLLIPDADEWTVVFNRIPDQWGNVTYNPAFDALRLPARADSAGHQEQLIFTFEQPAENELTLVFRWQRVRLSIPITQSPD